jgi:hypothetical protein
VVACGGFWVAVRYVYLIIISFTNYAKPWFLKEMLYGKKEEGIMEKPEKIQTLHPVEGKINKRILLSKYTIIKEH